jgi:hypothetical protein
MKTFRALFLEYREFQRTDKRSSVSTLNTAGRFEPNESGHIEFTTYHGGDLGETPKFASTPSERLKGIETSKLKITPNQPEHSFLGLSTTPDATAAREYRAKISNFAGFVANPKEIIDSSQKLYELKGRIHKDNVIKFGSYDDLHDWYAGVKNESLKSLYKDKKYLSMSKKRDELTKSKKWDTLSKHDDMMQSHMMDHIHSHITNNLGIHAAIIGTNRESGASGSGRARHSGEILLFKPHENITSVRERGAEVDKARAEIAPALERLRSIRKLRTNR